MIVIYLFYNNFKNVITQIPQAQQIIPADSKSSNLNKENLLSYEFEPEEDEILEDLLHQLSGDKSRKEVVKSDTLQRLQLEFILKDVFVKYDEVKIEKSSDLNVIAKAAGTKVSTIKKLNPELRQPATPNNGSYSLNIPFGKKESFYKQFNAIPDDEKFAVQKVEHRVQKGENLISIASKYRVLVADLQTINNISNINKLSVGQRLKIPVKGGLYSNYPEKKIYTVKKGDTLGHIAEDYNTRASEIRKWNNMGSSSNIYPGQKLTLFVKGQPVKDTPKKNVYIVKVGDNLSTIAKNNDTTVSKIKSWNSMKSSTIYPGQKLTIYFE